MSKRLQTESDDTIEQVDEIAQRLFGVTERMRKNFQETCDSFDLTAAQARTLLALNDRAPMRNLSDVLQCDASNVTGIADRLEAKDLVRRETSASDRRVTLLAITPKGERVRRRLQESINASSPVNVKLSAAEQTTLGDLLAKLDT